VQSLKTFVGAGQVAGDAGRSRLDVALWRAKAGILALAMGAGLVTFLALPAHGLLGLLVGLAGTLLAVVYFVARDRIGTPRDACVQSAKHMAAAARAELSTQSAAGFLERFRQSLDLAESEAEEAAKSSEARGFTRVRFAARHVPGNAEPIAGLSGGNELRHYLNNRLGVSLASSASGARRIILPKDESGAGGTVFASLDAVLDHIMAAGRGAVPRALLVTGTSATADAATEAISIARAFVAAGAQAVLLDLAHGPRSVAAALDLPRSPGLTDLCAGRAGFDDIVGVDAETPLHVIAAGSPRFAGSGDQQARFAPIFTALTETYDSVVLHADRAALRRLAAERRFEFPIVVAVLPAGTNATPDLSDFAALGSRLVAYEPAAKERRPRFLGWATQAGA
jgi:Mrp family chromosome partitioning ATPase